MSDVVVFAPDLMDRSKIAAAAPGAVFVPRVADLGDIAGPGAVVVVDLGRPGAPDAAAALCERGVRVVGFASHVDRDTIAAARRAGCEVLARSAFFGRIGEVLG